jgi:hypothetical protein
VLLLFGSGVSAQDDISPDLALYAVRMPGEKIGKGNALERFEIHASDGKQVSVINIWVTEPDGTGRVGIRGCESFGWIDSSRFFCEGTLNPSTGIYRYFDAKSGQELAERIGSEFTWSPDLSKIANFGNVPHFGDWDHKSDSLEVGNHRYPDGNDSGRHLFRSGIAWSPDSRKIAVVDHVYYGDADGFRVVAMRADTGLQLLCELKYHETNKDKWPAQHDFSLEWDGTKIIVEPPAGETEEIDLKPASRWIN